MMSLIRPSPERDPQDERSIISRLLVVKDKGLCQDKKDETMFFVFCEVLSDLWAKYIFWLILKGYDSLEVSSSKMSKGCRLATHL